MPTFLIFIIIAIVVFVIVKNVKNSIELRNYGISHEKYSDENTYQGKVGEFRVNKALGQDVYGVQHLINDIILLDEFGKTSQIDHIFINQFGIWVIETKTYSGTIFGSNEQRQWTQVLAGGNVKNHFYNPLLQNKTHIGKLKSHIGVNAPCNSVVVFVDGDLQYLTAGGVSRLSELKTVVNNGLPKLTSDQIEYYYSKIKNIKDSCTVTEEEHIYNVQKQQSDIANGICPRCGGKLVLRNGKYGDFYGCENYPKCTFKKNI